jgi:hypothetical protein
MVNTDLLFNLLFWFVFIFYSLASIYIFYLIVKNIMVYKVYGLTFWLLVFLNLAVVMIVIANSLEFEVYIAIKQGQNIAKDTTHRLYQLALASYFLAALETSLFDCVHWIFAMKYWSVACKLHSI